LGELIEYKLNHGLLECNLASSSVISPNMDQSDEAAHVEWRLTQHALNAVSHWSMTALS